MMNLGNMVRGLSSNTIAESLIQLWEHDEGTMRVWRASSNFVYVFERNQVQYFLRFSYAQENSIKQIKAELEFMGYLHGNNYPCVTPIPSKNGAIIETLKTQEGTYIAVVFSGAIGTNLESETITGNQMEEWGKSLASLHSLSKTFEPVYERRTSWMDTVKFMENVFQKHPDEQEAVQELKRVTSWLGTMPTTNSEFGLIHYDFELDNIFYNENANNCFNVIDFDDAVYHWFALDIVIAMDDFFDNDNPHSELLVQSFLRGYRSIATLESETVNYFPLFRRFARLYKFSKILSSLDYGEINETPAWLDGLQVKLVRIADELREGFSKNLVRQKN
ncbi:MAG: phosphotransferase enzyme family protein [Paenisporosarcina sp.]